MTKTTISQMLPGPPRAAAMVGVLVGVAVAAVGWWVGWSKGPNATATSLLGPEKLAIHGLSACLFVYLIGIILGLRQDRIRLDEVMRVGRSAGSEEGSVWYERG